MLDLRIIAQGRALTLQQAVAQLGARGATREIGGLIENMIAALDDLQGDVDLEDDDPAGDPLDKGELDEGVLGVPLYDVDQSSGPTNERAAYRAWQMSFRTSRS